LRPEQSGQGVLVHNRLKPVEHRFHYPVWMLCMDADRLDQDAANLPRWLPVRLSRDDLLSTGGSIRAAVDAKLRAAGHANAPGQILVIAQPRLYGHYFNPVVFYLCLDADGRLSAVLADINNTPWDERHVYVLQSATPGRRVDFRFAKIFHVSPFAAMERDYAWRFELDDHRLRVRMRLEQEGLPEFTAALDLALQPLSTRCLVRGALRFPLQSARTLLRIYWQALRLYVKRSPFHPHPGGLRPL
jgi:DUF1365 family protein